MNREELEKYKLFLKSLSHEDETERNLILKEISSGKRPGPMTGYPSIDKPWLKFYDRDAIVSDNPKCTVYEMILNKNKNNMHNNAIQYYNRYISYEELFDNIEKVAKSLKANGINKGDIISVSLPNIPESIYVFYALSKIGAIANMIDPRASTSDIKHYINEVQSNFAIILEDIIPKVEEIVDDTPIRKVVKVSAINSLQNVDYEEKYQMSSSVEVCDFKRFINEGNNYNKSTEVEYAVDTPVVIVHTGGTTGKPKGVLLSNDAINMIAHHFMLSDLKFDRNQKWLNIMPPFIAYGLGNGLHLPLSVGMCVVAVPKFEPDKIDDLIAEYKPNNFAGVPIHYESIIKSKKLDDIDFSKWILPGVGGDTMDSELEKEANKFLKAHNSKTNVIKGYGLTEVCAAACVTFCGANEIGSVGIPFVQNNISIFSTNDENEIQELGYNEIGEICISSPSIMLGYYKNEKETKNVLKKHMDGKIWMHTGDVGYMTKDGLVYIEGRTKRVIIRYDGFKIYPFDIEKIICSLPEVAFCKVVATPDVNHIQGNLPQANIILKPEYIGMEDKILSKIINLCNKNLAEYKIPSEYQFVKEFPRTPIGKVDYVAMEEKNKERKRRKI